MSNWDEIRCHSLFCWVDLFERILDDEDPNGLIKIILSTSWGHYFGLAGARSYLPETLQARVIGKIDPGTFSRGELILAHARRSQLENWIALDDDPNPWPNDYLDRLVLCDPKTGISNVEVQEQLRNKLGQYLFRY